MTLSITYPSGFVRIFKGFTQADINRHITYLSQLQEERPLEILKVEVRDEVKD